MKRDEQPAIARELPEIASVDAPSRKRAIATRLRDYLTLTKPRVSLLAVFTAFIGMLLAAPVAPPASTVVGGVIGIWLLAAASFALNCLLEAAVDARMKRTQRRPTAQGRLSTSETVLFALTLGALGSAVLVLFTNPLTWGLTVATFFGYAFLYTLLLKPNTPQNIVIGGLFGAMPPLLGWTAVANDVTPEPLLLVLIIFLWTPPHFWALALVRQEDYRRSGLPMLPITHGRAYTLLSMVLYTWLLFAASLLPIAIGMSGALYAVAALVLGARFLWLVHRLRRHYRDEASLSVFKYSLAYLALLFAAMLFDHYL
ncbi:MAG: heme o synthase [Casimicrobiaceae bacterium]|nr:heme o synthase [Casimicrobiaceae bacterium]MDW8312278.1 heme o synthase [Burkholderiales bacterium]